MFARSFAVARRSPPRTAAAAITRPALARPPWTPRRPSSRAWASRRISSTRRSRYRTRRVLARCPAPLLTTHAVAAATATRSAREMLRPPSSGFSAVWATTQRPTCRSRTCRTSTAWTISTASIAWIASTSCTAPPPRVPRQPPRTHRHRLLPLRPPLLCRLQKSSCRPSERAQRPPPCHRRRRRQRHRRHRHRHRALPAPRAQPQRRFPSRAARRIPSYVPATLSVADWRVRCWRRALTHGHGGVAQTGTVTRHPLSPGT